MLAQTALLAVVDVAAGKAAQVIDLRHRLPKHFLRRRLQAMVFEQCIGPRQRATGQKAAAQPRLAALDAPYVLQRAVGRRRAVGLCPVTQVAGFQRLPAQRWVIA
ncbi:hypothetical protein D3C75_1067360 [compost metagenome]